MRERIEQLSRFVRQPLADIHWRVRHREVGWVTRVGDSAASVRGLPTIRYGELLERADGLTALAFDVRRHDVGIVFLDPSEHVSAGEELRATGRVASVPVGEELLGRVVDVLGRPLDGQPPLRSTITRP